MDPALTRLVEAGRPDQDIAVLVRLADPGAAAPAGCRVVSRLGTIRTVRVPRGGVEALRANPVVRSVKAPRTYVVEHTVPAPDQAGRTGPAAVRPDPAAAGSHAPGPDGSGAVVAVVDWGFDLAHPALRRADGSTRVLALWDQQPGPDPLRPNRFGYGRIFGRDAVDAALATADVTAALGYDHGAADPGGGAHGTATTSVAAGSACHDGPAGVAPGADLVLVHLSTWGPQGPVDIGDSVALVEAVDFVRETAGPRPWVLNLSMGAHHGPHDGSLLVERALDAAVADGGVVVQSSGNYHGRRTHAAGTLAPDQVVDLPFDVPVGTVGPPEVDLWYRGRDRIAVALVPPGAPAGPWAGADESVRVQGQQGLLGRVQHRDLDRDNGRGHVAVTVTDPVPGRWTLRLRAVDVVDGRYDAWIARARRRDRQPRFDALVAVDDTVTGTISNGWRTLSVGGYDPTRPGRPVAAFSSGGPTLDGRRKPDLLAPGVDVPVARSRPTGAGAEPSPSWTRMNGTSMAAPHVTGAIACLLGTPGPWDAARLRAALLRSCRPYDGPDPGRAGAGYLDLTALLALADRARPPGPDPTQEDLVTTSPFDPSTLATAAPAAAPAVPGAAPRDLLDTYALGRRPDLAARWSDRFRVLAGPTTTLDPWALAPGDLLVRGRIGEGHVLVATLVDGEVTDLRGAMRRGWDVEDGSPGRYALVTEDGERPRTAADRWARRLSDARGEVPLGTVVLRRLDAADGARHSQDATDLGEVSERPKVATRKDKPYVRWFQGELNRLQGAGLVIDGVSGRLTKAAVRRFQTEHPPLTVDGLVGAQTEAALIAAGAVPPPGSTLPPPAEPPAPPAEPPAPPAGPPDPPLTTPPDTLDQLETRYLRPRVAVPASDIAPVARAVEVRPIVDGRRYFAEIAAAIDALQAGDLCWVLGLNPHHDFRFSDGVTLADRLVRSAASGVDVRLIAWVSTWLMRSPLFRARQPGELLMCRENIRTATVLRSATVPGTAGQPLANRVLLDWSGNLSSSHHMKSVVVRRAGQLQAFVGGIDFVQNRDDAAPHPARGWHDAGVSVRGHAALRAAETFGTRWEECSTLPPEAGPGGSPYNPPAGALPALPVLSADPLPNRIDLAAQVVRSFPRIKYPSATGVQRWSTLPSGGVHEIRTTLRAAISGARRYVYVEDQYFDAVRSLFPALVDACRRGIKVVALLSGEADPRDAVTGTVNRDLSPAVRGGIVDRLDPSQRDGLAVWALDGVTVHSKLVIVDDRFMCIGSANFQDRSMEFDTGAKLGDDSELSVAAVTTGDLVRDLRTELWAEHLRAGADQLAPVRDLDSSLPWWLDRAPTLRTTFPRSRLRFVGPASSVPLTDLIPQRARLAEDLLLGQGGPAPAAGDPNSLYG